MTAEEIVRLLELRPHPEGGWFGETYRAAEQVVLPRGPRAASTAIYFLLTADMFSALHRIRSDEGWHFYLGDPVELVTIDEAGARRDVRLGPWLARDERPQHMVPAGAWFGARVAPGGSWALVGCTVAPGFDFADFELAERAALAARYPAHAELIGRMTRVP